MPISFRRSVSAGSGLLIPVILLCLAGLTAPQAFAQDTPSPASVAFMKQLDRIDFAVSAEGNISDTVSGVENRDATTTHSVLTIHPSTSVGELVTIRYTVKPYLGFEYNFGNARYTENTKFVPTPSANLLLGGVQTGVRELTLGYVAHLPYRPFGITPVLGVGGGTIHFTPTPGGGQGLPNQYRAVYYYNAGLEDNFPGSHFGMRIGFRQLIYLAPDFLENYLTITRRLRTSEPTVGFFVRF